MGEASDTDPEMFALQEQYPGWRLWRAQRGPGDEARLGSYMASRLSRDAGVSPTLMCSSVAQLRRELQDQADAVKDGRAQYEPSPQGTTW